MKQVFISIALLVFLGCTSSPRGAEKLASVESESTWDLTGLFKNEIEWQREIDAIKSQLGGIKACQGRLAKSAKELYRCLHLSTTLSRRTSGVSKWASLQASTDSKNVKFAEYRQKSSNLWSLLGQARSFMRPEIVRISTKRIARFLRTEKRLKEYKHYLNSLMRTKEHTLSSSEEKLLSMFSPVIWGANSTALLSSDIEWNEIETSEGKKLTINTVEYANSRSLKNRSDRRKVYNAFYSKLSQYEKSFGQSLYSNIKARVTTAKARKHKSALDMRLAGNNIPKDIYLNLVKQVNRRLPVLHRYLKLKAKMLKIPQLKYHDLYVQPFKLNRSFSIADSKKMALETLKPFGEDYLSKLRRGFAGRWMHMYPAKNKRGGAYVSGHYDTHPYVFLNHQNTLDSLSTFTHEWGHAVHNMLADEAQTYVNSHYDILTAELASIVNEVLLNDYLLKNAKDKNEEIFYLNNALENVRTTFFRQVQFAEFELKLHQAVENDEPLTGRKMSEIYGDVIRRYYGHGKGVVEIDEKYFSEWSYIRHFYRGFYVYKYATSMAGAHYYADRFLNGDLKARDQFISLLKAGGSDYPHNVLLDNGLDLTKDHAYDAFFKIVNSYLDRLEVLLE